MEIGRAAVKSTLQETLCPDWVLPVVDSYAILGQRPMIQSVPERMRNQHPIMTGVSWVGLGAGCALIYSGWQSAPGLEGLLAFGLTIVLFALGLLSLRYLW